MEQLISSEDMAIIDENSSYLGVPTILLMENAGRELARIVQSQSNINDKSVIIFAGTGNNGGDSFVFARHICRHCKEVKVVLIGDQKKIRTKISRINWYALQNMEFSIEIFNVRDSSEVNSLSTIQADVVIDGLLGTGIRGRVREPIASAIKLINNLNGYFLILLNRFLPGVRSAISVAGGISRLKAFKVTLLALLSCGVWNFIWILLGYALGTHWESVQEEISDIMMRYNITIFVLFCLVILVIVIKRKRIREKKEL